VRFPSEPKKTRSPPISRNTLVWISSWSAGTQRHHTACAAGSLHPNRVKSERTLGRVAQLREESGSPNQRATKHRRLLGALIGIRDFTPSG
jgi:hypothetical protein